MQKYDLYAFVFHIIANYSEILLRGQFPSQFVFIYISFDIVIG